MMKLSNTIDTIGRAVMIAGMAFLAGAVFLLLADVSPLEAYGHLLKGSLGSTGKFFYVLQTWTPLAMCACGLVYTFRAGLLNIGVEGQMIWGAICCTAVLRWGEAWGCPVLTLSLAVLAALVGGAWWGLLAGVLKTRGGVNEIFGGLGLNFVAQGAVLWLIFGPWKRAGVASMSGTELLPPELWLPTWISGRVSPVGLFLALILVALTVVLLSGTNLGLYLRTVGASTRASFLLGLRPERYLLLTMAVSGGWAGLAGAVQVGGVYHCLIPSISGNYGYLALLVVMLAANSIGAAAVIAFLFAAMNVGGIQLPLMMHLDSSFCGVLQGALVLAALAVYSRREKNEAKSEWTG